MSQFVVLADRIKELSHSSGPGDFILDGPANGFSAFNSVYNHGDYLYYAITDGIGYEIGSGQYLVQGPSDYRLRRFPFKSTNGNALVSFGGGIKEVYVTYPGQRAVFTAYGFEGFTKPLTSGIAFWANDQILDYDGNLVWDANNSRLGVKTSSPQYTLDVQGNAYFSSLTLGSSGITFANGVQNEPFRKNQLAAGTNISSLIELSGVVNEYLGFKTQPHSTVLAGPISGPNGFPSFRFLSASDIPDLSSLYVKQTGVGFLGNLAFYNSNRVVEYDSFLTWDSDNNYLGINKSFPTRWF
jgi:hypothetical protein